MPLAKEIEFPLFHLGTYTSQSGAKVTFTDAMLRQMERNGNFLVRSRILQAPVKYDHPAFGAADKENHGRLVGYRYANGTLHAIGTNWSDKLVKDVEREARIAYSGEFADNFEYPDPSSRKMVKIDGPAPIGLAILGAERPAIKNLKPLSEFQFGEEINAADAWLAREELQKAGLLAEDFDGRYFFAEVTNDATRFFSESRTEDGMDEAAIQRLLDAQATKLQQGFDQQIKALKDEQDKKIQSFSEQAKQTEKVIAFCETASKEKPFGKLFHDTLRKEMLEATPTEAERIQRIITALPATAPPFKMAEKKKERDGGEPDDDNGEEPKALMVLRAKHFTDRENPANQQKIVDGINAFAELKPDAFKGIENDPVAQTQKLLTYINARDAAN